MSIERPASASAEYSRGVKRHLVNSLAHLRKETNSLVPVDADYRWRLEATAPTLPHGAQPQGGAATPSTRERPQAAPAPYALSGDLWALDTGRRAATAQPGSRQAAKSERPTRLSASPSIEPAQSAHSSPSGGRRTDAMLAPPTLKHGAWLVLGYDPPGEFYLSRPPRSRIEAECDEPCDVDSLRRRAHDGQLAAAVARARQVEAEVAARLRAARQAAREQGRTKLREGGGSPRLQERVVAGLPQRERQPEERAVVVTAGAVRGDLVRSTAQALGVWQPEPLVRTATLAYGVEGGPRGNRRADGSHGPANGALLVAPKAGVRAISIQVPNLSARQIKYNHLEVMDAGPARCTGRWAAIAERQEESRRSKDEAVARHKAAQAERRDRTARQRGELGQPMRVGILPVAAVPVSRVQQLQRMELAAMAREAAREAAQAAVDSAEAGGGHDRRSGCKEGRKEGRKEHSKAHGSQSWTSGHGHSAQPQDDRPGGSGSHRCSSRSSAHRSTASSAVAANAPRSDDNDNSLNVPLAGEGLHAQIARLTLRAERLQMGWLGTAHDDDAHDDE